MTDIMLALICAVMVAINVPGMLEGNPFSIGAGIWCAVCTGWILAFLGR